MLTCKSMNVIVCRSRFEPYKSAIAEKVTRLRVNPKAYEEEAEGVEPPLPDAYYYYDDDDATSTTTVSSVNEVRERERGDEPTRISIESMVVYASLMTSLVQVADGSRPKKTSCCGFITKFFTTIGRRMRTFWTTLWGCF